MTPIKGKLTIGGKSALPDKKGGVTIVFLPVVTEGMVTTTYPADPLNPDDNTFEVKGPAGKGIPHGKYKVTLSFMMPIHTPAIQQMNDKYSEANTPIVIDVTGAEVVIDLAKFK